MSYPTVACFDNVTYPSAASGTTSRIFSVPKGAISCVVFPPNAAGAWNVVCVPPPDGDQTTLSTQALVFAAQPATDGAAIEVTMTAFTANTAIAFDACMFGGGLLAFTGASSAAVDSLTFKVVWNVVGQSAA